MITLRLDPQLEQIIKSVAYQLGCLVFLGDKLKINEIATVNKGFDVYRLKGNKTFTTYIK